MNYHAPTKQFTITLDQIQSSASTLLFAIKMVRKSAGLPLEGIAPAGAAMTDAHHAEQSILDACRSIGIDLGATRAGVLDVREAG